MKAVITQAGEVEMNGQQSVMFDIVDDEGKTLVSSQSATDDVEHIEDKVRSLTTDFKAKYLSNKKLVVGDEVEV